MCEAVGHPVITLERVAFGPLRLGRLAPGEHRRLTAAEVKALGRATQPPRPSGRGPSRSR
jgi:16S rRNA U516 pseudouridylate synthase RsuA-like enzyme